MQCQRLVFQFRYPVRFRIDGVLDSVFLLLRQVLAAQPDFGLQRSRLTLQFSYPSLFRIDRRLDSILLFLRHVLAARLQFLLQRGSFRLQLRNAPRFHVNGALDINIFLGILQRLFALQNSYQFSFNIRESLNLGILDSIRSVLLCLRRRDFLFLFCLPGVILFRLPALLQFPFSVYPLSFYLIQLCLQSILVCDTCGSCAFQESVIPVVCEFTIIKAYRLIAFHFRNLQLDIRCHRLHFARALFTRFFGTREFSTMPRFLLLVIAGVNCPDVIIFRILDF